MYQMAIDTPRKELSGTARGKADQFHHCKQKIRVTAKQTHSRKSFVHDSGCQRLGPLEATRWLVEHEYRLFFLGDSVTLQMWLSAWKARRFVFPHTPLLGRWPHAQILSCGALSDSAFEFRVDRLLRGMTRPAGDGWHSKECSDKDVLVLTMGLWYNAQREACGVSGYGDLRDHIIENSPLLRSLEDAPQHEPQPLALDSEDGCWAHNATARRLCGDLTGTWKPGDEDDCTRSKNAQCFDRELTHCAYARDLRRLAKWIQRNRARLPRHVFFLDSPPQRVESAKTDVFKKVQLSAADEGRWRNVIARAVFRRFAPTVTYLRVEEALVDQLRDGHYDVSHWCIDSLGWEEAMSVLLSAIVAQADGQPHEAGRSARRLQNSSRCDRPGRLPAKDGPPVPPEAFMHARQFEFLASSAMPRAGSTVSKRQLFR